MLLMAQPASQHAAAFPCNPGHLNLLMWLLRLQQSMAGCMQNRKSYASDAQSRRLSCLLILLIVSMLIMARGGTCGFCSN